MTTNLERLKAQKRGHRGVVTKLSTESRVLLDGEEITDKGQHRLRLIHGQLQEKATLLSELDEQKIELSEVTVIEADIIESNDIVGSIVGLSEETQHRLERPAPTETDKHRAIEPCTESVVPLMQEDPLQNDSPSPPPSSEVDRSDSRVSNTPNVA